MKNKKYIAGALFFLVGILFMIGAFNKTISDDLAVIVILWICALAFIVAGVWQLKKI